MITFPDDPVAGLRYRALDDDPELFAAALYGPAWEDTLRYHSERDDWTHRRLPKAVDVADVLGPVLRGAIYHDGRSTRDGRGTGWWAFTGGGWIEADLALVGRSLTRLLDELLAEAKQNRDAEAAIPLPERPDFQRDARAPRYHAARARRRTAGLRYRLLDVLRAFVAGSASTLGGLAEHLRSDPSFRLSTGARDAIFRSVLEEVALDFAPGELVPARELYLAFHDHGFGLTRPDFYACATRAAAAGILGTRRRTHDGHAYRMPDDPAADADADAHPQDADADAAA